MSNLSNIDLGAPVQPASGAGRTGLSDQEPRPRSADPIETAGPEPAKVTEEETATRYERAVEMLQESLDQVSGPRRDVNLEFFDGNYVVEIRRQDDGTLLQRFPPENLLNPKDPAADYLGTVIDRQG